MSKREMIQRIMSLNRSARPEFLQQFSENDLNDYLRQLEGLNNRVRHSRTRKRPN
ncbi:MAG: hypothetical protein L6Q92_04495 [Phycisphaerae bacterium]|nr:hypothetical protein [Phycisphaerae bacterium]